MRTSELTGAALDWAVAKCEGVALLDPHNNEWELCWTLLADNSGDYYAPSTDWAQGGPIIERERFDRMTLNMSGGYTASIKTVTLGPAGDEDEAIIKWVHGVGDTPLVAAMRCYVASKLGDEVEIPNELTMLGE